MERRSNPVCITLVTERNIFRVIKIAKVIQIRKKEKEKEKEKVKVIGRQLLEKWVLRYCAQ